MSKYRIGIGSNAYQSIEVEADSEGDAEAFAMSQTTVEDPIIESVQVL